MRWTLWTVETQAEATERELAEAAEELGTLAGRREEWASRYRHLRLVHTAVVHKHKPGTRRQFVVMRRCNFQPQDAAVVRAQGDDPFLQGNVSWRKGGTQKVDGYWRTLRRRVAHRGYNTGDMAEGLRDMVLVHTWSHSAGPGTDLLTHLGNTLKARRQRSVVDMEVGRRAWHEVGEEEDAGEVPEHVHSSDRIRVEQVWRRQAVVGRGTQRAREVRAEELAAKDRRARVEMAKGAFTTAAAQRAVLRARARAEWEVARAQAGAAAAQEQHTASVAATAEQADRAQQQQANAELDALLAASPATPVGIPEVAGEVDIPRPAASSRADPSGEVGAGGSVGAGRRRLRRLGEVAAAAAASDRRHLELTRDACNKQATTLAWHAALDHLAGADP